MEAAQPVPDDDGDIDVRVSVRYARSGSAKYGSSAASPVVSNGIFAMPLREKRLTPGETDSLSVSLIVAESPVLKPPVRPRRRCPFR